MTTIRPDDGDLRNTLDAIDNLAKFGGNPRQALLRIGQYQERQFARAFAADRGPSGQPWRPLAASTRMQKRNPKALVEKIGRIPSSRFHQVTGRGRLEVGYGDPLAIVHHHGGRTRPHIIRARKGKALFWKGAAHPVKSVKHPGSVLPARELIGYSARDVQAWKEIVQGEAARVWNNA